MFLDVVPSMTRPPGRDEVQVMQAFDRVLRKQTEDAKSTELLVGVTLQHMDLWCDMVRKGVSPECYERLGAVAEFGDGFISCISLDRINRAQSSKARKRVLT